MILLLPRLIPKLIFCSFLIWIILLTAIPQVSMKFTSAEIRASKFLRPTYPYNSITLPTPLPIRNSTVFFVIGHPDDEVMFFLPLVVELSKKKHNNNVKIVCFSRGDAVDPSMGDIRAEELRSLARILGVEKQNVIVLEKYKDGMDEHWDQAAIRSSLAGILKNEKNTVFITFDEYGVSNHSNHILLYHGTRSFFERSKNSNSRMYVLKSLGFLEKYLFTLLTNVELFVDLLLRFVLRNLLKVNVNVSFFSQSNISLVRIYLDLNMLSVLYAAMAFGHYSQMVWFRYGWLLLSRYLAYNNLIQIH